MGFWNPCLVCLCASSTLNLPVDAGQSGLGPFLLGYFFIILMECLTILLGFQAFHNTRMRIYEKNKRKRKDFFEKSGVEKKEVDISSEPLIKKRETDSHPSESQDVDIILPSPKKKDDEGIIIQEEYDDNLKSDFEKQEHHLEVSEDRTIEDDGKKTFEKTTTTQYKYFDLSIPMITQQHIPSYLSYVGDFIFILALLPFTQAIALVENLLLVFTVDEDVISVIAMFILPVFIAFSTAIILLFPNLLTVLLSVLTNINVAAILAIVILGSVVAIDLDKKDDNPEVENHWDNILDPIFVAKLTVCRNCFFLPFIFSRSRPTKKHTRWFIVAVFAGLFTSSVMTTLWTVVVLSTVPQTESEPGAPSLNSARENGLLAPIPFSQVVSDLYPSLSFASTLMVLFIMFALLIMYHVGVISLRHVFYGFYERIMETNFGYMLRDKCYSPKVMFGLLLFFMYTLLMAFTCQVTFRNVGILLEVYDSLATLFADWVILIIILSDLFLKRRIEGCYIINRTLSIFLAIILVVYYAFFLVANLVHVGIRIVG